MEGISPNLSNVLNLLSEVREWMKKGYKVTDSGKQRKFGVVCGTLDELLKKGQEKLGLGEQCVVALEDGTLVQDQPYFDTIPAHTLFVFYKLHEPIITGVDLVLNALKSINASVLNLKPDVAQVIRAKAQELSGILRRSRSAEDAVGNCAQTDPLWFQGLDTNAATKEDFMFRKAQDRIRGYYYKFQDDVKKSPQYKEQEKRNVLCDVLKGFKKRLEMDRFFGSYFDRRCAGDATAQALSKGTRTKKKAKMDGVAVMSLHNSFCDNAGLFLCEGVWRLTNCAYTEEHAINPYTSREARVVFSTWNLDHKIEKSRTILPGLLSAVDGLSDSSCINVDYFYMLLFSRVNLKLVHIVCHDKASHDIPCNQRLFYIPKHS